jgi:hypothetical protein
VPVRSIEEPNQPKNYIGVGMNISMEKPGKDASLVEKARYLEEGFWDSYAEGIDESDEDNEVEDQSKESN